MQVFKIHCPRCCSEEILYLDQQDLLECDGCGFVFSLIIPETED